MNEAGAFLTRARNGPIALAVCGVMKTQSLINGSRGL